MPHWPTEARAGNNVQCTYRSGNQEPQALCMVLVRQGNENPGEPFVNRFSFFIPGHLNLLLLLGKCFASSQVSKCYVNL